MKHIVWIFLTILMSGCNDSTKLAEMELQAEELKSAVDSMVERNHWLEHKLDSLNKTSTWFDNSIEGKYLLEAGIANPGEFIISSLRQQPELVPVEPVLGGTMRFTRIQLLGSNCLIAYYEDGHIAGRAIFSFNLRNGELNFSLVRKCPS